MKKTYLVLIACVLVLASACSILKEEDPERGARDFLLSFQQLLPKSDIDVLKQFRTELSARTLLSLIHILQNKEDRLIRCDIAVNNAVITPEEHLFKVEIPAMFTLKETREEDNAATVLTIWLKSLDDRFVISKVDVETFHQAYVNLRNKNEWQLAEQRAVGEREPILEMALALEPGFDTVIWYARHRDSYFFYVGRGEWNIESPGNGDFEMGLVDQHGELIIPVEYDLIGTISFDKPGIVEVKKDDKYGYFDLLTRQLIIPAEYDIIIPQGPAGEWAVVKKDTVFGWFNDAQQYTQGFASEISAEWIRNFKYLRTPITLQAGEKVVCEIPRQEATGNGIIIPPSYAVRHNLFSEIESGITTTEFPFNAWVESKTTEGGFIQTVTDQIDVIVTNIVDRYLEGREEFYKSNHVLFVDSNRETLLATRISGSSLSVRAIDSVVLEVKSSQRYDDGDLFFEGPLTSYQYFVIEDSGTIANLKTRREFAQTQFVKLDSSYLSGGFQFYNSKSEDFYNLQFAPREIVQWMHDEILASYGYAFPGEPGKEFLTEQAWNTVSYSSIDEFRDQLTEIDLYNLDFLERVLAAMEPRLHVDTASPEESL